MLARLSLDDFRSVLRSFFVRGTVGANSLLSFTSLAAQFFSNVVIVMILARLVDVATMGEILYATVFANIAVVLASYGFENLIIREVSQKHYSIHEITLNLLLAKLLLSGLLVLVVAFFIDLAPIPLSQPGDLWFYFGAALINSFINSLNALRKGKNDFATEMKVSLFRSSLFFVGTLIAVFTLGATTLLVGQVRLLTRLVALFFAAIVFLKRLQQEERGVYSWGPKLATVWELFVTGFPFGLQAILGTAYFQLDVLVLGALKTSTEVGFYQAPMQLITVVMLVPIAVIQAYYPRLAKVFSEPGLGGLPLMKQMMGVLVVLGFGFTVLFGLGASLLITIIYGAKMGPSIPVMRILSLVFVVRATAGGLGISLMAVGLQKVPALAGFIALVGSLGLNLLLIPKGGFITVAWVNLTTNLSILCLYALWWKRALSARLPMALRISP